MHRLAEPSAVGTRRLRSEGGFVIPSPLVRSQSGRPRARRGRVSSQNRSRTGTLPPALDCACARQDTRPTWLRWVSSRVLTRGTAFALAVGACGTPALVRADSPFAVSKRPQDPTPLFVPRVGHEAGPDADLRDIGDEDLDDLASSAAYAPADSGEGSPRSAAFLEQLDAAFATRTGLVPSASPRALTSPLLVSPATPGLGATQTPLSYVMGLGMGPGTVAQPAGRPPGAAPAEDPALDPAVDPEGREQAAEDPFDASQGAAPTVPPPVLLRKRNVPPFWIQRELSTHTTRALTFPPLFIHRAPKPIAAGGDPSKYLHIDLALNFAWHSSRASKDWWINPALLFFHGKSAIRSGWLFAPMLMAYRRTGEQFTFGQFPLIWVWGNKYVRNAFVLPLHYHQKTPGAWFGMTALVAWYGWKGRDTETIDDDRAWIVVGPAFIRAKKAAKRLDFGLPYVGYSDTAKGLRSNTILPLVHWQRSEFGNRKELWTLAFIQRSDRARVRKSWAVPPLLTFRSQHREHDLLSVTPLLWRAKDSERQRTTWVAGPYGQLRDPDSAVTWFAPLFMHAKDRRTGARAVGVFPLFYGRKSENGSGFGTLLGGGRKDADGRIRVGTLPGIYVDRKPNGEHTAVGGPIYWSLSRNADPSIGREAIRGGGLGPLGWYVRRGDKKSFGALPLLTFTHRSPERAVTVATPLVWHVGRGPKSARSHIVGVGPFYGGGNKDSWHAGALPLLALQGGNKTRTVIAPPILLGHRADLVAGTSRTISPWYVRDTAPDHKVTGVLGLGWSVKRGSHKTLAIVPAFLKVEKDPTHRWWATPALIAGRTNGDVRYWFALSAYGTKNATRSGFGFAPLFHHERRSGEAAGSTTFVLPLMLRDRRPGLELDAYTPLVWRSQVQGEKPRTNLAVVPLYFRQRQPNGVNVDAGFPWFYSRDKIRRTHTIVAGPFFHKQTRKYLQTGFLPITFWHDSKSKRILVATPLWTSVEDKIARKRTTVFIPVWFDRLQTNGRRTWFAFPFVLGVRGQFNHTRMGIALPGVVDIFRLAKNKRIRGWLPFYFDYKKCGYRLEDEPECRYHLRGSIPFFIYGKDGLGRKTHGSLVYVWDQTPSSKRLMTWVGGFDYRKDKKLSWYALTLYHGVTTTHKTNAFLPLFFHRTHRTKLESTTDILGPLFITQRKGDRRWFETGLVYWQFRRPHEVAVAIVPPIFFHKNTYAERRLTWFLPVFVHDDHPGADRRTHALFPIAFGYGRVGDKETAVQFPLVWHFKRGDRQFSTGAFVYYDVRRGDKATQILPALYAHGRRGDRDTWVAGPGLAWGTVSGDALTPNRSWRMLFGLFGGGNEDGNRYAVVFGAKVKLAPKATRARRARTGKSGRAKRLPPVPGSEASSTSQRPPNAATSTGSGGAAATSTGGKPAKAGKKRRVKGT